MKTFISVLAAILVAAVVIGVGLVLLDYVMNGPKSAREMPVISLALQ
jgi:type IV secretory pathway TrbL component